MAVSQPSDEGADNFVGSGLAGDRIVLQPAVGKKLEQIIFPQEDTSGDDVMKKLSSFRSTEWRQLRFLEQRVHT